MTSFLYFQKPLKLFLSFSKSLCSVIFFIRLLKNNFLWKPVGKAKTGHDKLKRFYPDSILTKKHTFFSVYCLFAAETPFTPASKVESLYPFLETFRNCSSTEICKKCQTMLILNSNRSKDSFFMVLSSFGLGCLDKIVQR